MCSFSVIHWENQWLLLIVFAGPHIAYILYIVYMRSSDLAYLWYIINWKFVLLMDLMLS